MAWETRRYNSSLANTSAKHWSFYHEYGSRFPRAIMQYSAHLGKLFLSYLRVAMDMEGSMLP
eukprot:10960179-Ditylum_brightwellii.AAC.1